MVKEGREGGCKLRDEGEAGRLMEITETEMEKEFEVGEKWGFIKMRRVRVEVRGKLNGEGQGDLRKENQRDCWIDGQRHGVLIKIHSRIQMMDSSKM